MINFVHLFLVQEQTRYDGIEHRFRSWENSQMVWVYFFYSFLAFLFFYPRSHWNHSPVPSATRVCARLLRCLCRICKRANSSIWIWYKLFFWCRAFSNIFLSRSCWFWIIAKEESVDVEEVEEVEVEDETGPIRADMPEAERAVAVEMGPVDSKDDNDTLGPRVREFRS